MFSIPTHISTCVLYPPVMFGLISVTALKLPHCNAWIMCPSHPLGFERLDGQTRVPEGAHTANYSPQPQSSAVLPQLAKSHISSGSSWLTCLFFAELETWPTPGDTISHNPHIYFFEFHWLVGVKWSSLGFACFFSLM